VAGGGGGWGWRVAGGSRPSIAIRRCGGQSTEQEPRGQEPREKPKTTVAVGLRCHLAGDFGDPMLGQGSGRSRSGLFRSCGMAGRGPLGVKVGRLRQGLAHKHSQTPIQTQTVSFLSCRKNGVRVRGGARDPVAGSPARCFHACNVTGWREPGIRSMTAQTHLSES